MSNRWSRDRELPLIPGAKAAGLTKPFLEKALEGEEEVVDRIERLR